MCRLKWGIIVCRQSASLRPTGTGQYPSSVSIPLTDDLLFAIVNANCLQFTAIRVGVSQQMPHARYRRHPSSLARTQNVWIADSSS
jgi:hypothetical protein